jgi:hypothetical protein
MAVVVGAAVVVVVGAAVVVVGAAVVVVVRTGVVLVVVVGAAVVVVGGCAVVVLGAGVVVVNGTAVVVYGSGVVTGMPVVVGIGWVVVGMPVVGGMGCVVTGMPVVGGGDGGDVGVSARAGIAGVTMGSRTMDNPATARLVITWRRERLAGREVSATSRPALSSSARASLRSASAWGRGTLKARCSRAVNCSTEVWPSQCRHTRLVVALRTKVRSRCQSWIPSPSPMACTRIVLIF